MTTSKEDIENNDVRGHMKNLKYSLPHNLTVFRQ